MLHHNTGAAPLPRYGVANICSIGASDFCLLKCSKFLLLGAALNFLSLFSENYFFIALTLFKKSEFHS